MHETPDEVLRGQQPWLEESAVKGLPPDGDIELLRQQRIRFDGFFSGPTW
ncbi:hypothetical protein [Mycobacterium sp. 1274761.0]|nr:hypothetical protein [Mycobacterium sp. 1274761.0]